MDRSRRSARPARIGSHGLCALVLATVLAAAACGSDSKKTSSSGGDKKTKSTTVDVTLSDDGCDPRSIATKAGPVTFAVTNDGSSSVTEFEVLKAKRILGEVENVIPGGDRSFTLTLKEGSYTTKCPNGDKFDSGIVEVAAAATTGEARSSKAQQQAVGTYLTYVKKQADDLVAAVKPFVAAVKAGDVATAKKEFAAAREPYETIEPIAESFGGLDPAIDARAGDVPVAKWTGFHRIEKQLWAQGNATGMTPIADKLATDVADLRSKVQSLKLEPAQIANGAVGLLDEVSVSKISGEEDRYSHTDLSDFEANVAGAKAAFVAVRPLLSEKQRALATDIDKRFAAVETALAKYKSTDPTGNGYALYGTLRPADTRGLSAVVDALAEPLSRVAAEVA